MEGKEQDKPSTTSRSCIPQYPEAAPQPAQAGSCLQPCPTAQRPQGSREHSADPTGNPLCLGSLRPHRQCHGQTDRPLRRLCLPRFIDLMRSTGPSSPGKWAGSRTRHGQAEPGTSQPLTPEPAQPEVAQGQDGITETRKGRRHWAEGSNGTWARGAQPLGRVSGTRISRTQPGYSAQASPLGQH